MIERTRCCWSENQFSFTLRSLFLAILLIAVHLAVLSLLANMNVTYQVSFSCFRIPADDTELTKWYGSHYGEKDLVVSRQGRKLHVHFSKRGVFDFPALPPLGDLGYGTSAGSVACPSLPGPYPPPVLLRWFAYIVCGVEMLVAASWLSGGVWKRRSMP